MDGGGLVSLATRLCEQWKFLIASIRERIAKLGAQRYTRGVRFFVHLFGLGAMLIYRFCGQIGPQIACFGRSVLSVQPVLVSMLHPMIALNTLYWLDQSNLLS